MSLRTYIINARAQAGGEHELHDLHTCNHLPAIENQRPVGQFENCAMAMIHARSRYPSLLIDGCQHCSPACHRR